MKYLLNHKRELNLSYLTLLGPLLCLNLIQRMAVAVGKTWKVKSYTQQSEKEWPGFGRHILAQYDDDSIVVYQAYCPEIAEYAVKHQKFGGDKFSYSRMSWIKTNFLWMMYRSGWATKTRQERILAVRISREGFDTILSHARTKDTGTGEKSSVRLQWDPDHDPNGLPLARRAIQLGLRNEILQKYGNEWIVEIKDITDFVTEQHEKVNTNQLDTLLVAEEQVYPITDRTLAEQLQMPTTNEK